MDYLGLYVDQQENMCIVTEYINGGSLHDVLHTKPITWSWNRKIKVSTSYLRFTVFTLVRNRDLVTWRKAIEREILVKGICVVQAFASVDMADLRPKYRFLDSGQ